MSFYPKPQILERQLELLYRNQRLGQIISILNASLLVWIAGGSTPGTALVLWWLLAVGIALLRLLNAQAYARRSSRGPESDQRWHRQAAAGALLSGLIWGGGALLLMRNDDSIVDLFTAFTMAGMVAGAVPVLGADRKIFRSYALPIVLAIAWGGFDTDPLHLAFTAMSALFLVISLRSADHFHLALTETLRLEQEKSELLHNLEISRQQTERSNRAKTEFLANISHELRTPMNGIIGLSSLLADEELNDHQQALLTPLRESADKLLHQIEHLITLSALEAGHIKHLPTHFATDELLTNLLAQQRSEAQAKQITLSIHPCDPPLPPILTGDLAKLREILLHLVDNAIKFNHRGGEVVIDLKQQATRPGGLTLCICVSDNGPGIRADELARLNDLLVQADGSSRRKHGGIGVGLPIVRKYVELMGGQLTIDSQEGVGSKFCCHLPFSIPDDDLAGQA